ncbi:testisin-like [Cyprinodon tularosa]|uniref:testisin-like n=1 Tax=Cyprinodon tularosa TaxID=77115 RepID=UPI0018E2390B|nr:testisin-like [Cyprinodon tularosa]
MAVAKLIAVLVLLQSSADSMGAAVRSSIVGGDDAPKGSWPSLVYLDIKTDSGKRKWHCSGTILNENWVMTAGRCWDDELWSRWDRTGVWVGVHELDKPAERYSKVITVDRLNDFAAVGKSFVNDIALIKLKKPLDFSTMKHTSPVKLPEEDETFDSSSECWIAGWGEKGSDKNPNSLQQLKVSILPQEKCSRIFPDITTEKYSDKMVCAGVPNAQNKNACDGDYGDPLMCKTSRGFVQVGIMSSGNPDGCNSASLTIYTKVSGYMGYINARLNPVTKELA